MPPPEYSGIWKLLYDWQTIIAGALAIIAAAIGARAAYRIGNAQMAAAKEKEQLQAHCLAVGISPELIEIRVLYERALEIVENEYPKAKQEGRGPQPTGDLILAARIPIPPVLSRAFDQLYVMPGVGPTLLQMISIMLQYNSLIETLAEHVKLNRASFDATESLLSLGGQLRAIGINLGDAERLIKPIHDGLIAQG